MIFLIVALITRSWTWVWVALILDAVLAIAWVVMLSRAAGSATGTALASAK